MRPHLSVHARVYMHARMCARTRARARARTRDAHARTDTQWERECLSRMPVHPTCWFCCRMCSMWLKSVSATSVGKATNGRISAPTAARSSPSTCVFEPGRVNGLRLLSCQSFNFVFHHRHFSASFICVHRRTDITGTFRISAPHYPAGARAGAAPRGLVNILPSLTKRRLPALQRYGSTPPCGADPSCGAKLSL